LATRTEQEKKTEDPKSNLPKARKEVKLMTWEVMKVIPTTPEYLKWPEVPITFEQSDHSEFIPKLGRHPLIVSPIIKDVRLNRVLIDGGSLINVLFLKSFNQMGLPRSALRPSRAPFHGILPGIRAAPIGQITIPVMFGTWENCRTKYMQFKVADFEMTYYTFLRRSALTKFMVIPHYTYLVMKMSGPNGVIPIKEDIKRAYDYDQESCEMVDALLASMEHQNLKKPWLTGPGNARF
jgi:hypothetical protein